MAKTARKNGTKGGRGAVAPRLPDVMSVKLQPEVREAVGQILAEKRATSHDPFMPLSSVLRDLVREAVVARGLLK